MKEKEIPVLWKPIEYDELYHISSDGAVLNTKTKRILKTTKNSEGYATVTLEVKGKIKKRYRVHRLVATAFVPNNAPEKIYVDHINRIRDDNRAENLRWVTPLGNRKNAGPSTRPVIVNELVLRKILSLYKKGFSQHEIYKFIKNKRLYKNKLI